MSASSGLRVRLVFCLVLPVVSGWISRGGAKDVLCSSGVLFSGGYIDFPYRVITAEFPRQYSLTHRDFLGALMNLGLRREAIGDILVEEGRGSSVPLGNGGRSGPLGTRQSWTGWTQAHRRTAGAVAGSPCISGDRRNSQLTAAGLCGSTPDPGKPRDHSSSDPQWVGDS